MFWKKIYLTLYYFRWTIMILAVVGAFAIYFHTNTVGTFLITAITSVLQAFVEKVREIGQQLELESQAQEASRNILSEPEHTRTELRNVAIGSTSRAWAVLLNWQEIFGRAKKTFITLGIVLALLVSVSLIYLYFYF